MGQVRVEQVRLGQAGLLHKMGDSDEISNWGVGVGICKLRKLVSGGGWMAWHGMR
jgi:hypothetical protein